MGKVAAGTGPGVPDETLITFGDYSEPTLIQRDGRAFWRMAARSESVVVCADVWASTAVNPGETMDMGVEVLVGSNPDGLQVEILDHEFKGGFGRKTAWVAAGHEIIISARNYGGPANAVMRVMAGEVRTVQTPSETRTLSAGHSDFPGRSADFRYDQAWNTNDINYAYPDKPHVMAGNIESWAGQLELVGGQIVDSPATYGLVWERNYGTSDYEQLDYEERTYTGIPIGPTQSPYHPFAPRDTIGMNGGLYGRTPIDPPDPARYDYPKIGNRPQGEPNYIGEIVEGNFSQHLPAEAIDFVWDWARLGVVLPNFAVSWDYVTLYDPLPPPPDSPFFRSIYTEITYLSGARDLAEGDYRLPLETSALVEAESQTYVGPSARVSFKVGRQGRDYVDGGTLSEMSLRSVTTAPQFIVSPGSIEEFMRQSKPYEQPLDGEIRMSNIAELEAGGSAYGSGAAVIKKLEVAIDAGPSSLAAVEWYCSPVPERTGDRFDKTIPRQGFYRYEGTKTGRTQGWTSGWENFLANRAHVATNGSGFVDVSDQLVKDTDYAGVPGDLLLVGLPSEVLTSATPSWFPRSEYTIRIRTKAEREDGGSYYEQTPDIENFIEHVSYQMPAFRYQVDYVPYYFATAPEVFEIPAEGTEAISGGLRRVNRRFSV